MSSLGRRVLVPGVLSFILFAISTQFAPPARSQANVTGQWQTLPYTMPINPVHAALLRTGKVLIVSGSGNVATNTTFLAAIWDPQAGTITTQPLTWDMFCDGMVILPDGRPFILGGTLQYDPFFGQSRTATYDLTTGTFTDQQLMSHGRWYPTGTVLGDGRVMVFSGLLETGATNTTVEIYNPSSGWSASTSAPWTPPLYPRLHVLPNGKVFYSGSGVDSAIFTPSTNSWVHPLTITNFANHRTYGSSVLLPLTPANNFTPKVMILGGANPSTATTEIIDLSAANPTWIFGPSMSQPRIEMNATLLPNGKVLALGGSLNDEDTTTASLNADLYDPNSNTFSSAGAEAFERLYHSISLLMPDGTVVVAGGNPTRGTYEPHMEIYSPAYLFNSNGSLATRPTITSLSSSQIGYGGAFTVTTPDAANISSVVVLRNGAVTHAFNMDQRLVGLNFTKGSGVLNVTAPANGNLAPPGYYMIFILNAAGVPSVASMVQISSAPTDTPPTGTITSPASNVTINPGQSVSYAGSGTDPGGSISAFFWSFTGGNPSTSNLANPGAVTYPAAGTYTTTLTVTDNQGVTDPHPPSRTITVTALPDFSLSVSPPSRSITQGGGTTYTVTSTAIGGFAGTVSSFNVSGLPAGATASFNPTSIPASGSTTLTISTLGTTPANGYTLTVGATSGSFSHTATASLVIGQSGGTSTIDFGSGFSATGMQFNGSTVLNGTRLQLTNSAATKKAASAYWATPVNVQSFTNQFTFQLTNPAADGFTFILQNAGLTALGPNGGGLGYGPSVLTGAPGIGTSVAVKFDLSSNNGEGNNSTGLYTNGVSPTTPATTLGGGVNLHSGHIFQVQMTYDGTNLTMTITDTTVPADTFTIAFPINIPATVGGNTALVGFTGGTGGLTATQEILTWTYSTGGTGTPDFSISASPASQTVLPGSPTTYTVTIGALNGFTGTVTPTVSNLPADTTASFSPPTVTGGGSTTLTVTPSAASPTGTSPLTITGTSNALTHSTSVNLVVSAGPDFTISAASGSQTVTAGNSTTYTITIGALNGFTGTVTLGATGLPNAASASFSPSTVTTGGTSTMTVTTGSSTPPATSTLTISGTSGSLFHSTNANLVVSTGPDFSIAAAPGSQTITPGNSTTYTVTIGALSGFTGTVTMGATGLPSGASASFSPPTVTTSGTSTMTVTTGSGTPVATSTLTVTGTSGALSHSATTNLVVSAAPDFTISAAPGSQTVTPGNSTTYTVTVSALGGFTGTVTLGATGLPNAASASFSPPTVTTSGTSTMTVTTGSGTPVATSTLTVTGTSSSLSHSATTNLVVSAAPDFSVSAAPGSQTVNAGNSTTYTVTIGALNGFTGTVTLGASGLPNAAGASFSPPTVTTSGTSTMTVTTGSGTPPATSMLTITGTGGALTHSTTANLTVQTGGGGTTPVNFASGFSATGLQFNGNAKLNGTRLQLTDTSTTKEAGSAFWTTPVNVQSFTNNFTFQLTNPAADGFTFTIQNAGPTALGGNGGLLGYAGATKITPSVAVKFDLSNNSGEGNNSTGLYTDGAAPTVPATTFGGGVNLHSGHIFQVQMSYDGATLTMTITDTVVPADTFTISFPIDIPTTVGGNTALVGFTGGTGGLTAIQEILTWAYSTGGTATPDFSISAAPGSQTVTAGNPTTYTVTIGAQNGFTGTVTLGASGLPSGASASFSPPTVTTSGTSTMTVTTGSATPAATSTLTITGTSNALTHSTTSSLTVQTGGSTTPVNFATGFSATGMQFNGTTVLNGTRLQLTNAAATKQAASAFWTTPVNVQSFTNKFTFQLTTPTADGVTFTIQNAGPTALGGNGGLLGYAGATKITPSVAVKFDLANNAGEGNNSTGLYTNGASPSTPATTLAGGVNLHSGDIFQVQMTYDGTTLTMVITDTAVPADTFTIAFPIDIPTTVGGSTALVGFTGGTGALTSTQEILTWTYSTP